MRRGRSAAPLGAGAGRRAPLPLPPTRGGARPPPCCFSAAASAREWGWSRGWPCSSNLRHLRHAGQQRHTAHPAVFRRAPHRLQGRLKALAQRQTRRGPRGSPSKPYTPRPTSRRAAAASSLAVMCSRVICRGGKEAGRLRLGAKPSASSTSISAEAAVEEVREALSVSLLCCGACRNALAKTPPPAAPPRWRPRARGGAGRRPSQAPLCHSTCPASMLAREPTERCQGRRTRRCPARPAELPAPPSGHERAWHPASEVSSRPQGLLAKGLPSSPRQPPCDLGASSGRRAPWAGCWALLQRWGGAAGPPHVERRRTATAERTAAAPAL